MGIEDDSAGQIRSELAKLKKSGIWLTLNETHRSAERLAQKIRGKYTDSPLPVLCFLSRGGWDIQTQIIDILDIQASETLQIGLERLEDVGAGVPKFEVGQAPAIEQVRGRDVLLVDTACRSGSKLIFTQELMKGLGARSVESAVLIDTTGNSPDDYHPDIYEIRDPSGTYYTLRWEQDAIIERYERLKTLMAEPHQE